LFERHIGQPHRFGKQGKSIIIGRRWGSSHGPQVLALDQRGKQSSEMVNPARLPSRY
jgi:hypothetical protein